MACDGGSHFGGVRPRTKKPNFSQDKSKCLSSQSLPVLSTPPPVGPQGGHGHPLNSSRSLFSPISAHHPFVDGQMKAAQYKEVGLAAGKGPLAGGDASVQESIYSEVAHLLSQWEEQPGVLRDLLDQIRSFQVTPQPPATAHRSNLLHFSSTASERSEESSTSTCHSKLSKQSFGSKCFKSHNASSSKPTGVGQQQSGQGNPTVVGASPTTALPSSQRHSQFYAPDAIKNQEASHVMMMQAAQRQGTGGMESIPESYTASMKSEKPDIVSQLRGGLGGEVAVSAPSEESCSLASSVSSPASSSSSHNNNNKGTLFNCPSQQQQQQQSEDYRAAPDGGAALPPSPPLQAPRSSPGPLLPPSAPPPPPPHPQPPAGATKFPEDWYDAEGETEAETEDDDTKDLAEADQSAGQINLGQHDLRDMVIDGSVRSGSSSLSLAAAGGADAEGAEGGEDQGTLSTEIISTGSSSSSTNPCCSCPPVAPGANGTLDSNSCEHSCLSSSTQGSAPDLDVDELALDDVPIKLETLSPEELHRQMLEEQTSNTLLAEMMMDPPVQLAPDTEAGLTRAGAF